MVASFPLQPSGSGRWLQLTLGKEKGRTHLWGDKGDVDLFPPSFLPERGMKGGIKGMG
jgi:hypothetical protein